VALFVLGFRFLIDMLALAASAHVRTSQGGVSPLGPERWVELSPYLDHALDLEDDERPGWLASLATDDAELASQLRVLLADHDVLQESSFLEKSVPPPAPPDAWLKGQRLGAYRLLSNIGEGGMGSVWLAERCDGRFAGRAAVKLLNMALMGHAGQERFRREGDVLARLSHPHIARLIDAGVSPTGQPFLVLEHVQGKSIDSYCDEHGLDVDARLRLFLDVLDAVAHAHANLIVHRDIKPPNVLVTGDGHVKLLDFGIAKLLEEDARSGAAMPAEIGALTREAGAALTPAFAAPEQMTGGQITTATDVYTLGVLLYVLLTGRHPAGDGLHSTARLVRAIVETEPGRVSDAAIASGTPEMQARHAADRGTTPARLRRRLQGDLDVIVAKALKKTAAERYPSVAALADDLRRSLRHEPIRARADTLWYRTTTFVRRHRAGVAGAAAMILLTGGLTGFYTSQLATERDRARLEADKAAKVSELLTGLLTAADPYATRETRGEPTVRGLLDAGAARLQKDLDGQPELQAEMLTVIGRIYQRLGLHDKAQPLLERSLALGRQAAGRDDVRVAQSLNDLGVLLRDRSDFAAARATLEEALGMRRRLLGEEHKDVAVTLVELGRAYVDSGLQDRAEPLFRSALKIRRKVLGEWDRNTGTSLSDLGRLLWRKGETAAAEPLLRQSLVITRRALAGDHPDQGTALANVALVEQDYGRHAEAERMLREALALHRASLGNHHRRVASTLNFLAQSLQEQGKFGEAATALDEAMAIARATSGDEHPFTATVMVSQARLQLARSKPAAAEALLRRALQIFERKFPENDGRIATAKSLLGASLTALARYAEAEALLQDSHRVLKDAHGRQGRELRDTATRLVALYEAWGQPGRATPYRDTRSRS
jgi:serine/threonine protein kinase/tetratricopeptide (TPR) repeat protein